MQEREYYGIRKGYVEKNNELSFDLFKKAFLLSFNDFEANRYFQKYFGFICEEDGFVLGEFGKDIETKIYLKTGQEKLWPIEYYITSYTEVEIFTLIELLYDNCSKPTEIVNHGWNGNCIHGREFNDEKGKEDFRNEINPILKRYKNVELSENGEILESIESGFEYLIHAKIPTEQDAIVSKLESAKKKFRRASSSTDDRKDALRDLADILENLRPKIKSVLMNKEENELFLIANNFGIRHFNKKQKDEYDKPLWHSWFFYCYLSTIHLCLRLIEKQKL